MFKALTALAPLFAGAALVAGCGGQQSSNGDRPSSPLQVSVYLSEDSVDLSPKAIRAGAATVSVVNRSGEDQILTVQSDSMRSERSGTKAETELIKDGSSTEISVLLVEGNYNLSASAGSLSEANLNVRASDSNSNDQLSTP